MATDWRLPVKIKEHVKNWMIHYADRYSKATTLAEDAARVFNHDEWLADETHWIWDLAIEIIPTA